MEETFAQQHWATLQVYNTCSGISNLKASPLGGQQLQQKDKNRRKAKKPKTPTQNFDLCTYKAKMS